MLDQPCISVLVCLARRMLSAIDFDRKSTFTTEEVDNESTDGLLPHKFVVAESARRCPWMNGAIAVRVQP